MVMRQKWVLAVLVMLSFSVFGFVESAQAARRMMVVGTAPARSAAFPFMIGVATIVNKAGPELALSPQETGGSVANIRLLDEGKIELSGFSAAVAASAVEGKKPFKKKRKVSVLLSMYQQRYVWFARKASGIKSWADVAGKKIIVGSAGGSTRVVGTLVAKAMGMDKKADLKFLRPGAMIGALRNGTADAGYGLITGVSVVPFVKQVLATVPVNVYGTNEATITKLSNSKPGIFRGDIPAGLIKGMGAFSTVGEYLVMGASPKLSNSDAYNIVKAVYENYKRLPTFTPTIKKGSKPTGLARGLPGNVSFHPGSARFFKEKGLLK
jgi:TRAP transporter TAXI family solute receptor